MSSLISSLLANSADDPLVMVGMLLAIWVPICAVILGLLALLAGVQNYRFARRSLKRSIPVPPAEVRPLAMRRYVTVGAPAGRAVGTARVMLAVIAVAGFTTLFLLANAPLIMAALGRSTVG